MFETMHMSGSKKGKIWTKTVEIRRKNELSIYFKISTELVTKLSFMDEQSRRILRLKNHHREEEVSAHLWWFSYKRQAWVCEYSKGVKA